MSDQQIRDEAMTIFLAGHETTANAMAWTWHLLGSSPAIERRLHEELSRVLDGRDANGRGRAEARATRAMIVAESMRLYPPAWTMGRRAIERHTIDGHTIEPGALVIVSQWIAHHDQRWWTDPDTFNPDRWSREERSAEVRLLPVWRRLAHLHRRIVRVDRGDPAAGDDCAEVVVRAGHRANDGAAHHAQAERPEHARELTLRPSRRRSFPVAFWRQQAHSARSEVTHASLRAPDR